MNRSLVLTVSLLALTACSRKSSIEERLIGTWEMPASTTLYDARTPDAPFPVKSKDMVQITFTPARKEIWRRGADEAVAKWHLEGDYLVFTLETQAEAGPPGTTQRQKIKRITAEELVFTDGEKEFQWTRVK